MLWFVLGLIIQRGLCVSGHVVTSEFNDRESLERSQTGTWYLGYSRQLAKKQCKIDRERVFADVLDKKEAFKDYKNNRLRKTQN